MNINAFCRDLIDACHKSYWGDLDGGDLHEMFIRHGLAIDRPATAEDAAEDHWAEWGIEPGGTITVWSDEFKALLAGEK